MHIKYKNLTIRDAMAVDAEQLTAWWNDGAVMAHAGFPNGLGRIILSMLISWLFEQGFEKIVCKGRGSAGKDSVCDHY